METRSKMRNIATKIMAILMSAIYFTVSANVPVWALVGGEHGGDVVIENDVGASVTNSHTGENTVSAESLTVNNDSDRNIAGITVMSTNAQGDLSDSATATVTNNFTLRSDNPTSTTDKYTTGISVDCYDGLNVTFPSVSANVNIGGNATITENNASNRNTKGIDVNAEDGNQSNVDIDGSLSVTSAGSGSTTGINATTSNGGTVNVTIGDPATTNNEVVDVRSTGVLVQGIRTGVTSDADTQGTANIIVHGDVAATTSIAGQAIGANLRGNKSGAETNVQIDGSLSAESNDGISQGLLIETGNGTNGTAIVDIGKGISASGETADGIYIDANGDTDTNINVGKNSDGNAITVQSSATDPERAVNSRGINAQLSNNASAKINVEGNIIVNSETDGARGINAQGRVGTDLTVQVKGDVASNGAGIYIENPAIESSSVDIIIDGTVKSTADGIPTVITDGNIDNVNITAWKMESNEGTALFGRDAGNGISTTENSQDSIAECISYIIRVTQPEINNAPVNAISLANADGSVWNKTKAWNNGEGENPTMLNVAGENEKVYVKLDVPEGYELVAVYADAEKTVTLNRDDNGYYLVVPRGGGIDVNVALTLIQADPNPPQPGPGPNPPAPNPPAPNPPAPQPEDPDDPRPVNPDNPQPDPVIPVPVVSDDTDDTMTADVNVLSGSAAAINEVQNAISAINATPAGGTAQIAITSNKLDADLVRLLLARRDINVSLACFVNGKLCLIVIPAGADLSGLIEADGSISIARLAEVFGTVEV